jgi:acyl-CoA synthetase (AMP-forming)/AMP-acid ligase II
MDLKEAFAALDAAPHWRKRASYLDEWRQAGYHSGKVTSALIAERVAQRPDVQIVFGSLERPSQTTAGELLKESYGVAAAFHRLGLSEGDVLVSQMPNWREGSLTMLAALHLGLIFVPMVHIYGPSEMAFIINTVGAKAVVVPDRWKKIDYGARIGALGEVPTLEHVITVGSEAMPVAVTRWADLDRTEIRLPELFAKPNDPWLIMFTSGTTSAPKGVVHTHHSFAAEISLFPAAPSPKGGMKLLPMPAGHSAGMIANLRPFIAGDGCVLMDAWHEQLALDLIQQHRPDRAGGVPYTVSFMLDHAEELFPDGLVQMSVGAASVPASLMERAERHGFPGTRTYGSTEHPTISGGFPEDPFEKRTTTDGRLLPGVQVRLVDDDGVTVGTGEPGEIVSMGPELFKGYLDPAQNESAFAQDGWFHTGDIGQLDKEGYLRIVDRKKDIIIRGGENISSKEVEDVLALHPAISEAAVVAWPDDRLGERVAAFVKLRQPGTIAIEDITEHFKVFGIARQKTPERIVVVEDFPRTPAGKILKTELRAKVKSLSKQEEIAR